MMLMNFPFDFNFSESLCINQIKIIFILDFSTEYTEISWYAVCTTVNSILVFKSLINIDWSLNSEFTSHAFVITLVFLNCYLYTDSKLFLPPDNYFGENGILIDISLGFAKI